MMMTTLRWRRMALLLPMLALIAAPARADESFGAITANGSLRIDGAPEVQPDDVDALVIDDSAAEADSAANADPVEVAGDDASVSEAIVPEEDRAEDASSSGKRLLPALEQLPERNEPSGESLTQRFREAPWQEMGRIGGALGAVLVLLFGLRAVLRRFAGPMAGGGKPQGVIDVLARYPIARGQSLVLIRLARRVLLIHQAAGTMSTLSEVSDPDEVAALIARLEAGSRSRDAVRFRKTLESFHQEHRDADVKDLPAALPSNDGAIETIDLTRKGRRRR